MPQVTHSVVDPVSGDPVGVRQVQIRVAAPDPNARVYRASDGFELAPVETVTLTPNGSGVYPSNWSIDLVANDDLQPAGSKYEVRQTFVGDDPRTQRASVPIVVPDGDGPYRLMDLLANPATSVGAVVAGVVPAGEYQAGTTYGLRQIVTHNGSAYVARATVTGVTPGTDTTKWQLLTAKGDTGAAGAKGDTGATGPANSLAIGTVTTGAAGSNASATVTGTAPSQTLNLGIPTGPQGPTGAKGDKGDTGNQGPAGPANSLAIGTVTTSAAGGSAAATVTGTAPSQTLNLTLPRGEQGPVGAGAPDATTTAKGSIQLAGDLAGTAAAPTVPGLAGKQNADPDLTAIAAIDSTQTGVMASEGAGWVRRTYTQVKTALGLAKADVGLGNVDNTSDAAKPISTATQTALDGKVTKGSIVLNVKDYGATGDGTTNDTTAIQNALNALGGGTVLVFPAGTYRVTSQLNITSKTDWRVSGSGATIDFAATFASTSGSGHALRVSGCQRFTIEGLRLNSVTQDQQYNGIFVTNSSAGRVVGNTVHNFRWAGMGVYDVVAGTSFDLDFEGNTVEYCRFSISISGKRVRVRSNYCADYWPTTAEATAMGGVWNNTSLYWDGIMLNSGTSHCVVSNNVIHQIGQSGIYTDNISDCTITGNVVTGSQNRNIDVGPINSGSCRNLSITGNVLVDAVSGNVNINATTDTTVTGNTLRYTTVLDRSGIALNGENQRVSVVGNTIDQATSDKFGVFVNDVVPRTTDCLFSANIIKGGAGGYQLNRAYNSVLDDVPRLPAPPSGYYFYTSSPHGTSTSNTLGNGSLRVTPWRVDRTVSITRLAADISAAGEAGSKLRLGIYADSNGLPGTLLLDAGQINGDSATVQELTVALTLAPGIYWVGGVVQAVTTTQPTVRIAAQPYTPPITLPLTPTLPAAGNTTMGLIAGALVTGTLPSTFPTGSSNTSNFVPRVIAKAA